MVCHFAVPFQIQIQTKPTHLTGGAASIDRDAVDNGVTGVRYALFDKKPSTSYPELDR